MPQKTFVISKEQLEKLKKAKIIDRSNLKSEYEQLRGKIEKSTIVVYESRHGLTLLIQNLTPVVEKRVEKIIGKETRRIIEIDDTGWGEPVGGVFIVGRDLQSGKVSKQEIHAKFFQEPKFKTGKYYIETVRAVNSILYDLNADPNRTTIKICSGTIFSQVYRFLENNGYDYKKVKIRGETQNIAKGIFDSYLKKIDCPRGYKKMKLWLKEDKEEREKYAKTGWKEFQE